MTPTSRLQTSFFKRLLFAVKVEGGSAFPELIPSKYYLATSLKTPKVGSFVVFYNPLNQRQILVKKVKSVENSGFYVEGTVSWATSSKEIGIVLSENILGTLTGL